MNPHGIIIFGANGSGKSTLGKELARLLDYKYMDIENYCFVKSEIPYTALLTHRFTSKSEIFCLMFLAIPFCELVILVAPLCLI